MTPATAIVAIGRNEGERLRRCLLSIPAGTTVIYVDSRSTDGSVDWARQYGAKVVELDLSVPFTAARARNAGLAELERLAPETVYVQFVDGDCEFEPGWITAATRFLDDHPQAGVVCGRRRERFPDASVYNRLCDAEWNTPVGQADACGGDALMRLAALRQVGGYDPAVVAGEEPELCARLRAIGIEVWRIDAPMTIHDAAILRIGQWWRRAVRGGFGYAQVWRLRGLYASEVKRAVIWAGVLPLTAIVMAVIFSPWWLLLLAAPLLQVIRLALRWGGSRLAWQKAFFLTLAKWPELQGILRYAGEAGKARPLPPTSYK
ncbi:MAG: glycosyltransferase [Proteobacteria bacterium]|nr:glycosyltransferase [Pseudomonadota bacterium]